MNALGSEPHPAVPEKPSDEYHLYTLRRRTTLRDRETKQIEFRIPPSGEKIVTYRVYYWW